MAGRLGLRRTRIVVASVALSVLSLLQFATVAQAAVGITITSVTATNPGTPRLEVECTSNTDGTTSGSVGFVYRVSGTSTFSSLVDAKKYTAAQAALVTRHVLSGGPLQAGATYDIRCRIKPTSASTATNSVPRTVTVPTASAAVISASKQALAVAEAGTSDELTVRLTSPPTDPVVVRMTSSDPTEGQVDPAAMTFTASTWNIPQTMTLVGVDDSEVDGTQGYQVTLSIDDVASDAGYRDVADVTVAASTTDDDAPPPQGVRILAAGDVCDVVPSPGPLCTSTGSYIRAQLAQGLTDYVLELGDMQYNVSNRADLNSSYDSANGWRGLGHVTIPVVGNHEQGTGATKFSASAGGVTQQFPDGYCRYFEATNANGDGFGPASTLVDPACSPYVSAITNVSSPSYGRGGMSYRVDLGAWSVISMESTGTVLAAQVEQLSRLLAAAGDDHVLLAVHHPFWSSYCANPTEISDALAQGRQPPHCHGGESKPIGGTAWASKKYWTVALARGVDIIATAHDHKYERFVPMDTAGPRASGIPEFLAGLGGAHPDPGCSEREPGSAFCLGKVDPSNPAASAQNSVDAGGQALTASSGLLSLELRNDGTYAWSFVDTTSYPTSVRVLDEGTGAPR